MTTIFTQERPHGFSMLRRRYPGCESAFGKGLLVSADLPYSWDFLVENLMDPSHVAFSHHGILGKRSALFSRAYTARSVPHMNLSTFYMLAARHAGRPLDRTIIA